MRFKLRMIAFLVLAAAPLTAAEELLRKETPLDLQTLARAGDRFGTSVALSGDGKTLVVGAVQAGTKGTRSGAVHVFDLTDSGEWELKEGIPSTGDDTTAFDAFGYSVATNHDGTVIAVGAPFQDQDKGNAGAVYIWGEGNRVWEKIAAPDPAPNDNFGTSVALSQDGKVLAVGAPQPNPVPRGQLGPSGKAYLFHRNLEEWSKIGPLVPAQLITAEEEYSFFGFDVAVTALEKVVVLVAGAPGYGIDEKGAIFTYEFTREDWSKQRQPEPAEGAPSDELGISVAVSNDGSIVAAGARERGGEKKGPGKVQLFDPLTLREIIPLKPAGSDQLFGTAVAISGTGDTVMVGAPGSLNSSANNPQGFVYFFHRNGGSWGNKRSVIVKSCNDAQQDPSFGLSASLSGSVATIGIPLKDQRELQDAGMVCNLDLTGIEVAASLLEPKKKAGKTEPEGVPGEGVHYEITIKNLSSEPVRDVLVEVFFDNRRLSGFLPTCTVTEGGICGSIELKGDSFSTRINLSAGADATVALRARILPEATGSINVLRARLTPPDGILDLTVDAVEVPKLKLFPKADLGVQKNEVVEAIAARGDQLHYEVIFKNHGPSHVNQVDVAFQIAAGAIKRFCWTCQESGGANCPRGPRIEHCADGESGFIHTLALPPEGILAYAVKAETWDSTHRPLVREVVGNAIIRARSKIEDVSGNNELRALTILPIADLKATVYASVIAPERCPDKDDSLRVAPGEILELKAEIVNLGPDSVSHAQLSGEVQVGTILSGSIDSGGITWNCSSPLEGLGKGDKRTCTAQNIRLEPDLRLEPATLTSIVNVLELDLRADDDNEGNSKQIDIFDVRPISRLELMSQRKVLTADVESVAPGNPIEYDLTFTNKGPSSLLETSLAASFPDELSSIAWTCERQSLGAECSPLGMNTLVDPLVVLPYLGQIKYTVKANTDSGARGALEIDFGFSPEHGGDICQAKGLDIPLVPVSKLGVHLVADRTSGIPGGYLTYLLSLTNNGPSDVLEATVTSISPNVFVESWSRVSFDPTDVNCGPKSKTKQELEMEKVSSLKDTIGIPVNCTYNYGIRARIDSAAKESVKFDVILTPALGEAALAQPEEVVTSVQPKENPLVSKDFTSEGCRITFSPDFRPDLRSPARSPAPGTD